MVHSLRRPIYSLVLAIALAVTALFVGMRGVQAEKSTDHLHADGHEHAHGTADTGDHARYA